jgi:hypothetical protein
MCPTATLDVASMSTALGDLAIVSIAVPAPVADSLLGVLRVFGTERLLRKRNSCILQLAQVIEDCAFLLASYSCRMPDHWSYWSRRAMCWIRVEVTPKPRVCAESPSTLQMWAPRLKQVIKLCRRFT